MLLSMVAVSLTALSAAFFGWLSVMVVRQTRDQESARLRAIHWVVFWVCVAFAVGSLHRLAVQAVLNDWLPQATFEPLLTEFQIAQSIVAMAAAWLVLRKLQVVASPLAEIERVLGAFVDRVADVAPMDQLGLSKREQEVLEVMRRGAITDAEIAAELHIASETARSHVKSIFRKTGLADRRDLVVLALRSA